jgi:hypothetical protein
MASRPVMIASLLGASVGVPYLASQSQHTATSPTAVSSSSISTPASYASYSSAGSSTSTAWSSPSIQSTQSWSSAPQLLSSTSSVPAMPVSMASGGSFTRLPATGTTTVGTTTVLPATFGAVSPPSSATDGMQFTSAGQVLRFDVTKEWVCQNWTRKSTGPTDVGLLAIRVPLVMGTQMTSLAGSLTYFFDDRGQVQHISFHGKTGDATPLIQLMTQTYQFQQIPPPAGERVFEVRDGAGLHSELRLKPEPVLNSATPQQSVAVDLELARPGSPRVLPSRDPVLQVPQVAGPPVPQQPAPGASTSSGMTDSVKAAASNYWDQVRYATPDEYGLLRSKRWPQ